MIPAKTRADGRVQAGLEPKVSSSAGHELLAIHLPPLARCGSCSVPGTGSVPEPRAPFSAATPSVG